MHELMTLREMRYLRGRLDSIEKIQKLSAELKQVKRERDAAVEDMDYAASYGGSFCDICKYRGDECDKRKFYHAECWEWRGVKEDEA